MTVFPICHPEACASPVQWAVRAGFPIGIALMLAGCAHVKPPVLLTVPVAASLREPCTRPPIDVATVGGMGSTIVRQEAALTACQLKRDALLSAIDAQAAAAKQLAGK